MRNKADLGTEPFQQHSICNDLDFDDTVDEFVPPLTRNDMDGLYIHGNEYHSMCLNDPSFSLNNDNDSTHIQGEHSD